MRPLRLTAPPQLLPLQLARDHLRLGEENLDDAALTAARDAAVAMLDGPSGALDGFCAGLQTWRIFLPAFPSAGPLKLPFRPLVALVAVRYLDAEADEQTVDLGDLLSWSDENGTCVIKADGTDWPDTATGRPDIVRVDASFGHAAGQEPADIAHAARLLTAHFYENRGAAAFGGGFGILPMGVEAITANYRRLGEVV